MTSWFGRSPRPRPHLPAPRIIFGLLAFSLVLATVTAARASTVVLVRAPRPTGIAGEATIRLRGELVAAGFEVRVIDPPLGVDIRASLERTAVAPGVDAVVAILGGLDNDSPSGGPEQDSAELWVIDRVTGKTVVRRVPSQMGTGRAAEILSIRALELLRASFLEVALAAGRAPKLVEEPPPKDVTRWTNDAIVTAMANRWPSLWSIEVGGCVLGSLEGMTASLMPLFRLQRSLGERWGGRITLAGLGPPSRVSPGPGTGTVEVSQQFGVVEGVARFRSGQTFQPFMSMGVGALHFTASGNLFPPYEGMGSERWAALADVGLGMHVSFGGNRFELVLEVHAQVAQPYPVIRFFEAQVAAEGRPTLMSTLTLLTWM